MSRRTLVALLASLAVLVALAVAVSMSQRPATGSGQLLLPDLKARINDLDRIVVRAGGDRTVATLERSKDGWTLAERNGYAADVGKIRKNLIALAEATVIEEKTSNPELYERLGVGDIEKKDATGVRLDLGAGKEVTSVIIGKTSVGGGERAYARRAGEPTSWLVSGSFEVPAETAEWLDRSIIDLSSSRVRAVTITRPGAAPLRIEKEKPETPDYRVLNVPMKRELSFPAVGNAIATALSGLMLENVEPAAAFAPADVKPVVARFETFDGLVIEASTWQLPVGARVRFSASADQALADRLAPKAAAGNPDPAKAETKEVEAGANSAKSFADVKAEADQLNARLGNWVYTLPDFKGEQLTKKLDDLLAPRPPGK